MNHHSITHNSQQLLERRAKISRLLACLSELKNLENNSADCIVLHRLIVAIEADIFTLIESVNSEIACESVPLQSTELIPRVQRINVEERGSPNSTGNKDDQLRNALVPMQSTELIANVDTSRPRENDRSDSFSSSSSSNSEESDSISGSDSDSIEYYSDSYSDSNSESYSSSD